MNGQDLAQLTLSVEEAAIRLGIGRTLAYRLARTGELPGAMRVGRYLRVSRPALDRALGIHPSDPRRS